MQERQRRNEPCPAGEEHRETEPRQGTGIVMAVRYALRRGWPEEGNPKLSQSLWRSNAGSRTVSMRLLGGVKRGIVEFYGCVTRPVYSRVWALFYSELAFVIGRHQQQQVTGRMLISRRRGFQQAVQVSPPPCWPADDRYRTRIRIVPTRILSNIRTSTSTVPTSTVPTVPMYRTNVTITYQTLPYCRGSSRIRTTGRGDCTFPIFLTYINRPFLRFVRII